MRRLVPVVAVLATAGMTFASVTPARACYCALSPERLAEPEQVASLVADTDVITIGTMAEIIPGTGYLADRTGDVDAIVEAQRYLKGAGPERITVDDPADNGSCGFINQDSHNERYLLFLTVSGERYETHLCAGNAILSNGRLAPLDAGEYVAAVEAITGPGQPPDDTPVKEPTTGDDIPREAMWIAAVVLPIAFLAAATFVWRRQSAS